MLSAQLVRHIKVLCGFVLFYYFERFHSTMIFFFIPQNMCTFTSCTCVFLSHRHSRTRIQTNPNGISPSGLLFVTPRDGRRAVPYIRILHTHIHAHKHTHTYTHTHTKHTSCPLHYCVNQAYFRISVSVQIRVPADADVRVQGFDNICWL